MARELNFLSSHATTTWWYFSPWLPDFFYYNFFYFILFFLGELVLSRPLNINLPRYLLTGQWWRSKRNDPNPTSGHPFPCKCYTMVSNYNARSLRFSKSPPVCLCVWTSGEWILESSASSRFVEPFQSDGLFYLNSSDFHNKPCMVRTLLMF